MYTTLLLNFQKNHIILNSWNKKSLATCGKITKSKYASLTKVFLKIYT